MGGYQAHQQQQMLQQLLSKVFSEQQLCMQLAQELRVIAMRLQQWQS
jgi:hypothetical protein